MLLPGARLAAFALAALCAPAFAQHGSTTAVNPYTSAEHEQAGAKLFRSQCAGCHGPDGTGTGAGPNIASGAFVHGTSDEAVFRTISKGVPGTSMPGFAFSGLQIWELVTHIRELGIARAITRPTGNPQAGAIVFRANCSPCHTAANEGGISGPDLTGIGAKQSSAKIRESIRDPDADVPSPYWSLTAIPITGPAIHGTRLNEDTFSLQLRDPQGRLISLLKKDLKSIEVIRRSPMPSFAGKLTEAEINDVIAWLISLEQQK